MIVTKSANVPIIDHRQKDPNAQSPISRKPEVDAASVLGRPERRGEKRNSLCTRVVGGKIAHLCSPRMFCANKEMKQYFKTENKRNRSQRRVIKDG